MRIIGVLVIIAIMFFLFISFLYKKTNDYRNARIDIKTFDQKMSTKFGIVNLGSTYSKYAFGASSELNLKWGDFSLQAQSLEMDYRILKKYIDNIETDGVVLIVVAACLMLYKEAGTNPLYYDILDKNENAEYSLKQKLISRFPLIKNPKRAVAIFKDKAPYDNVYDNYPDVLNEEQSQAELLHLVNVWKQLFGLKDMKSVEVPLEIKKNIEHNQELLDQIIALCLEHNVRPVVVVPPFSERLNSFFSPEFKREIVEQKILECIGDRAIPFFNYQDDPYFQSRPELFTDGGFKLNERGSKIFIQKFLGDLAKQGYRLDNIKVQ